MNIKFKKIKLYKVKEYNHCYFIIYNYFILLNIFTLKFIYLFFYYIIYQI